MNGPSDASAIEPFARRAIARQRMPRLGRAVGDAESGIGETVEESAAKFFRNHVAAALNRLETPTLRGVGPIEKGAQHGRRHGDVADAVVMISFAR